jgi:hypothetical protein
MQFKNMSLSRYPQPLCCLHNRGTKFIGADFQHILQYFGSKDVPTSIHNPQANAACKHFINQLGMLSVYFLSQEIPFNDIINIAELVNSALATALHVTCSTIHITLGMTTGGMVFNCDMFLNIPLLTDLHMLQER